MVFGIVILPVFLITRHPAHRTDNEMSCGFEQSSHFSKTALPCLADQAVQTTAINDQVKRCRSALRKMADITDPKVRAQTCLRKAFFSPTDRGLREIHAPHIVTPPGKIFRSHRAIATPQLKDCCTGLREVLMLPKP